jgi:5-methylcytosine-specific restriction endonuclease McrA
LRSEERALASSVTDNIAASTETLAALSRLDASVKNALRTNEGPAVYRQWVVDTLRKIAEAEDRLAHAAPTRISAYVGASLERWWVAFLAAAVVTLIESTTGLQRFSEFGDWLWFAIFAAVYCLLSYLVIAPVADRRFAMRTLAHREQSAPALELKSLRQTERKRQTVASAIKQVEPYLKALENHNKRHERLLDVRRQIDEHQSVLSRRTDRSRAGVPSEVRQAVWRRDGGVCVKCRRGKGDGAKLHFDHIIPYSKGGSDTEENIQVLCIDCNLAKGARIE